MANGVANLMSFIGDFLDFCRSAHEAVVDHRRKRKHAETEADNVGAPASGEVAPTKEAQRQPFFTRGQRDAESG